MIARSFVVVALGGILCLSFAPGVRAIDDHDQHAVPAGLLKAVREATQDFRDVKVAMSAGYASLRQLRDRS